MEESEIRAPSALPLGKEPVPIGRESWVVTRT